MIWITDKGYEEIMEDSDESPPYLPAVKPSAPHPDEEHVVEKPVWEKDFKLFQDSIKKEKTKNYDDHIASSVFQNYKNVSNSPRILLLSYILQLQLLYTTSVSNQKQQEVS